MTTYYRIRALNGSVAHATTGLRRQQYGNYDYAPITACSVAIRHIDHAPADMPQCRRCARILAAAGVGWPQKSRSER